jgi:dihydroxyacetone kinase-like predicted kinase
MDPDEMRIVDSPDQPVARSVPEAERQVHWSGETLLQALETAAAYFAPQVPSVDALNVFPVPDGDTGTNMYETLKAACQEGRRAGHDRDRLVGRVLAAVAHGALMGARGNSGVILYQFLAGLAKAAEGAAELDGRTFASGLRRASELAYGAVINPVEGTMLTVIRAAADGAEQAVRSDDTLSAVLEAAVTGADIALARTPELLEILRQAEVVDAGGRGIVILLDGLHRFACASGRLIRTDRRLDALSAPGGAGARHRRFRLLHQLPGNR